MTTATVESYVIQYRQFANGNYTGPTISISAPTPLPVPATGTRMAIDDQVAGDKVQGVAIAVQQATNVKNSNGVVHAGTTITVDVE